MNAIITMTSAVAIAIQELVELDARRAVVACLAYSGEFYKALTPSEHERVRDHADGFGKLPFRKTELQKDMYWDWSHVRDSSDEAVARMAEEVRRIARDNERRALDAEMLETTSTCSTCGGSKMVRHERGLVSFPCPSCR